MSAQVGQPGQYYANATAVAKPAQVSGLNTDGTVHCLTTIIGTTVTEKSGVPYVDVGGAVPQSGNFFQAI